ncbi:ferredoxin [Streptomyces sp. NPDC001435]|uniref:ferredoxin n=1 Tax=unclassified Streptomyces TaxID=2593676 RepID=UPI0036B706CE
MEVRVDRDTCLGTGQCMMAVPEVFDQSEDDGKVLLATASPGPGQVTAVRMAAARCPAGAITLRHDDERTKQPSASEAS